MTSPEQRVELVKSESQRIQRYLEGLPNEDWTQTSACDAWEIRDVVAHLTASVDLYESAISRGITGDSNPPEGLSAAGVRSLMTRLEENTQRVINLRQDIGDRLLSVFSGRCQDLTKLFEGLADKDWQKLCYHPGKVIPAATCGLTSGRVGHSRVGHTLQVRHIERTIRPMPSGRDGLYPCVRGWDYVPPRY